MKWCFDTSALIEPWVRRYPRDLFAPVWTKLNALIAAHEIVAPTEVLIEIERQMDGLHDWAKGEAIALFRAPDRAVMEVYTDIVNRHPGFAKPNSNRSGADPFVVAMAEVHRIPVVTYETRAKKNAAPKIPDVCDARGIQCADLVDVLRATGFKL